ncbi:MAG: DUF2971 domain-containing protein [Candidatus Omnitrophota bacterium]|jgi:hypothetical protein
MNAIKQLNKDIELWHYTNADGLLGILESQSIWATDYRHLNDCLELKHAMSILRDRLLSQVLLIAQKIYEGSSEAKKYIDENGGINRISEEETRDTIDMIWKALMDMGSLFSVPCILSFCSYETAEGHISKNGLLSQWRGYGIDGGYAIIFNLTDLLNCFEREDKSFRYAGLGSGHVCYECKDLDERSDLGSYLNRVITFASKLYSYRVYRIDKPQVEGKDIEALMHCLSRFKHIGFEEEQEYRFFVFAWENEKLVKEKFPLANDKRSFREIKFRLQKGIQIPYVELFKDSGGLPIEKIVVGPHKEKEKRAESLKVYLRNKGFNDIRVECSEIPYVGQHISLG